MGLSCGKIFSIEVDPLTINIAIYIDSLTLMSVIFTVFLHFFFLTTFREALEIPSEKKFYLISCVAYVEGFFLELLFPLGSFQFLHQLCDFFFIFVYIKILILFSLVY